MSDPCSVWPHWRGSGVFLEGLLLTSSDSDISFWLQELAWSSSVGNMLMRLKWWWWCEWVDWWCFGRAITRRIETNDAALHCSTYLLYLPVAPIQKPEYERNTKTWESKIYKHESTRNTKNLCTSLLQQIQKYKHETHINTDTETKKKA